jgi:hypothetical protein
MACRRENRGVRQEQGTREAMILRSNLAQTILYDPAHPVSIAMKRMQDVPEVRIIEGRERNRP